MISFPIVEQIDVQKAHNAHVYKALIILDKFNV